MFDIPDNVQSAPAPAPRPAQKTIPQTAETSTGDTAVWTRLIDHYKGRLSVRNRVFLDMASGVVADGCLTVLCKDEFVKASLDNETVLSVLRKVTSREPGNAHPVQLAVESPEGDGQTWQMASRAHPDSRLSAPEPKPEPQPSLNCRPQQRAEPPRCLNRKRRPLPRRRPRHGRSLPQQHPRPAATRWTS